jgi:ABC-type lipoprotein release transport system permease subunit
MTGPWMRAGAELRHHWRGAVGLAILIGLAGTVVLGSVAGARRTESAYPRYLAVTHAADFLVATESSGTAPTIAFYHRVEGLPGVVRSGLVAGPLLASETNGKPDADVATVVQTMASEDGKAGYSVAGFRLIAGRMPRPDRPFEALANRTLASRRHLQVGSHFTMYRTPLTSGSFGSDPAPGELVPVTFTITGIGVSSDEVVPIAPNDGAPSMLVTPAYDRKYDIGTQINFDGVFVRLNPTTSHAAFVADVERTARASSPGKELHGIFIADLSSHAARAERSIHPEALALALFAALVALGALLTVGQVIARDIALASRDDRVLVSMGFDRRQLISVPLFRLAVPIGVGAFLAVLGATLASPLMPIGPARVAEPHPGISVDPTVLGAGFGAIVVVFLALALWVAWRTTRNAVTTSSSPRGFTRPPSRVVEFLTRAGLRPPAVIGIRMAVEPGRGRTAVPVRGAVAGMTLAVAAIIAVTIFSTNLTRLISTPRLYGDTWSFALDNQFSATPRQGVMHMLDKVPGIEAAAGGTYGDDSTLNGQAVPMVGIDPLMGSVFPTIVQGRAPRSPGEIALGAATMRQLNVTMGDRVVLRSQGRTHSLRIVGQVVLPSLGRGSFTPTDLGEGAVTVASLVAQPPAQPGSYNFVLLRYSDRTDPVSTTSQLARLMHQNGCPGDACLLSSDRVLPTDINSYNKVRSAPALLAAILAILAVAMMGHALISSVRRRRRDLAILLTLGFLKREVGYVAAWQASIVAVIAAAVGVPLGIVFGRSLWSLFAGQIGVPPAVDLPMSLLWTIPALVILANVIALLPAVSAARTRPAHALRSE